MKKGTSLFKSAVSLIGLTIIVKGVGFLKQAVMSYSYGTSVDMDIYLIVTTFIGEVGLMFFSSLAISLLTLYNEVKEKENRSKAEQMVSNALILLTLFSVVIVVIVLVFAKPISGLLAPGFTNAEKDLVVCYLKKTTFLIVNMCISNICTGILNAEKDFIISKSIGLIQSACIIIACIFFSEKYGIESLYVGFCAFYIIENVVLILRVLKKMKFSPYKVFYDKNILVLIKLSVPLFISNSIIEINAMIDKSIASVLKYGSVSALSYGNFLFNTIHSVIIGSITTVLLSFFSEYVSKREYQKIVTETRKCVLILFAVLIPMTIVCLINGSNIVKLIYGRGMFDRQSVKMTTEAFIGYTVGIIFIALRDVYVRIMYALQNTRAAMINGVLGVVINVFLSFCLSKVIGVIGISLADSISYFVVAIVGICTVNMLLPDMKNVISLKELLQFGLAASASFLLGTWVNRQLIIIQPFINLVLNSTATLLVFILMLILMKSPIILYMKKIVLK